MSNQDAACPDFKTIIIGAGFGGLGMGIRLKTAGDDSFLILERANELGGTWRDNTYPGCACDVPSVLYSFSFDQNPNWSQAFSGQPEILTYMKTCVQKFGIREKIRFNADAHKLIFDEASGRWTVFCKDGFSATAQFVVSAMGPLNRPQVPNIPGLDTFAGEIWHSSEWNHDYDLANKRVASIGTGASAIQYIPEIAADVRRLDVYQRTPPWIVPRDNGQRAEWRKKLYKALPFMMNLRRRFVYWMLELRILAFLNRSTFLQKQMRKIALGHVDSQISDPALRQKVVPDYQIGCKRILVSDDYYPALSRDNVELVAAGIKEITADGVIDHDGHKRPADVIILGTGFVASEYLIDMQVVGRDGRDLIAEWRKTGPEAYLGMQVSGFPNLFFLLGPNTGLGHNSVIHIIESNYNYIFDYMRLLKQRDVQFLDLDPAVQGEFVEQMQAKLAKTVWQSGGCKSWYQMDNGKNTTLWPGSTVEYRRLTRRVREEVFR